MKKLILIALFGSVVACGQQPTISNITIDSLDSSSVRLYFDVSGVTGSWSEVFYGVSSGVYPYNTKSINCYNRVDGCQAQGTTALVLTGLKPGTTYYVLPTARPNRDDNTNICNTAGCGALEQVITTLNNPVPSAPVEPTAWSPVLPDTSGYAIVPLAVGPTGECRAAQTVVSPDGWTVPAGTYLASALTIVGYGTVFEIPQGIACRVPPTNGGTTGYVLPSKARDNHCSGLCAMTDPNHRWIIFRTQQVNSGDFPPFGARTNPSYAPRLGKFYSAQPNVASQLFDAEAGANSIHHYWFQNVEFEDGPGYTNPIDYVDPGAFSFFARLGSTYQNENNQFLVLDRVYAHGPGAPTRHYQGFEIGGNYMAMVGTYTEHVESWRMTAWPSAPGSLQSANRVLSIPKNNYRFARNSPLLGMSAAATAQLLGITGAGTVVGNLYKDHLEIAYTSGIGTLQCAGCVAVSAAVPGTPPNALRLFTGVIRADGTFADISWMDEFQTSKYLMSFGVLTSDLKAAGGPYYIENNYIDGIGEGFYMDVQSSPFSNDDLTYTRNHQIWPKQAYGQDSGNQWRFAVRQHWESKRLHRALVRGNMFSDSWAQYNDGPGFLLSARPPYLVARANKDGITDVVVESNILSHGRSGIECSSGNPMDNGGNLPEPEPIKRVTIKNNLLFDLGRWLYCDTSVCAGLVSQAFLARPACQDLVIENNTVGPMYGPISSLLFVGGGHTLGNYLSFRKNVAYVSRGEGGQGGLTWGDWPTNGVANHAVVPSVIYNNAGSQPDFKASLDASFVNIAASVTPNYAWRENMLIGGWRDTNQTLAGIAEMNLGDFQSYINKRPAGDTLPTGNTMTARAASAKVRDALKFDFRITEATRFSPGGIGVDYEKLYRDAGIVTAVEQPLVAGTRASFTYTAPDSRACAVDVAPDGGSPLVWSRTSDGGGQRRRTATVTGLTPATTYQFRILCYFEQANDGVLYTDYHPDQITRGAFGTLPNQQATARVPFILGSVPGATSVRVVLTSLAGVATQAVCATSPCFLTVDKGDYNMQMDYLSASEAVLIDSAGKLSIR